MRSIKWTTLVDVCHVLLRTRAHYSASPPIVNILDLLFPKRCLGCGKIEKYFCIGCVGKIRVIEERETICPLCERPAIHGATHPRCKTDDCIDGLTSFFHYEGIIQKAVKALKYRFVSDVANEFISLIPQLSLPLSEDSVIVPIPLHSSRLRFRGFNQAKELGKFFTKRFSISLCSTILVRTKASKPQVEMKDKNERLDNLKNAFSIHNSAFPMPHSVVLFDDVFTTGATMRAAATVLKRAGATFVWGITMAR